eukprot:260630-Pyramimonas_sp.AAC.1
MESEGSRGEERPPEEGVVEMAARLAGSIAEGASGPDAATAPSTSVSPPPSGRAQDRPEPNYGDWSCEEFQRRRAVNNPLGGAPKCIRGRHQQEEAARHNETRQAARQAGQPYYVSMAQDSDEGNTTKSSFAVMLQGARAQNERLRK